MNYRKIPQLVADELRPLEAYLYLLLASKSDYNTLESDHGVSDHSAIVSRPDLSAHSTSLLAKSGDKSQDIVEKSREKIMEMMRERPEITQSELAESLQISVKAVEKQVKNLREQGLIHRVGPDKGGHWEVIEDKSK
jgi:predicted HTH transcriptional regulator